VSVTSAGIGRRRRLGCVAGGAGQTEWSTTARGTTSRTSCNNTTFHV